MHHSDTRQVIESVLADRGVPNALEISHLVFSELTIRALVGDARVLRWCEWPDCFRSYHVMTGPRPEIDGKGWVLSRHGGDVLLCPDHACTGHAPRRAEWESGWDYMIAHCECGATGERVQPASLDATNAWWRDHVREALASSANTATTQ